MGRRQSSSLSFQLAHHHHVTPFFFFFFYYNRTLYYTAHESTTSAIIRWSLEVMVMTIVFRLIRIINSSRSVSSDDNERRTRMRHRYKEMHSFKPMIDCNKWRCFPLWMQQHMREEEEDEIVSKMRMVECTWLRAWWTWPSPPPPPQAQQQQQSSQSSYIETIAAFNVARCQSTKNKLSTSSSWRAHISSNYVRSATQTILHRRTSHQLDDDKKISSSQ